MNHLQVLQEIQARGLTITAEGSDLRLQGPRELIDADLVGRIRDVKADLITHLTDSGFPLTPLQRGYLVGRSVAAEFGNVASQVYHEIEGHWDIDRLESALVSVIQDHSALRSRFTADGRQQEVSRPEVHIDRLDVRALPPPAHEECRLDLRRRRSHRMLATDAAPLIAAQVTVLTDDRMVLHVTHDGLVMDGISMFLFFRAWWAAYRDGQRSSPQPAFHDYVSAIQAVVESKPAQRSRAYWMDRLDDLPPYPDLPLRTDPRSISRPRFTQRLVQLAAPAWSALKDRAAAAGMTPTAVLLAAYAETLAGWGAGDRFTINTTVANRPPIHPGIYDAIGQFSDTMLVDVAVDPRLSFVDRARAVQTRLRTAMDNRHFSGLEVLRALARGGDPVRARAPFTFNSTLGYVDPDVDGSTLELFGPETFSVSQTPQVWLNAFVMQQRGALVVQLDGVDELFPEGLLDAFAAGYQAMLDGLSQGDAWAARTFDLRPAEQQARRRAANDTTVERPDRLLDEDFLVQAARTPQAPAVLTSRATMTYGELHRRASHAAAWLRKRSVGREEPVGLVMNRGPEQVVGIMAAILAGAAYLPVDASYPAERRAYMLCEGKVRCVLTNVDASVADGVAEPGRGVEVLVLDAASPPELDEPVSLPRLPGAGPDDLAYVLYTSGTTGRPKGVMVTHRSVANVVADCTARFGVGPADRFFGISAFTFDLSVYDVFGALSTGAAIVLPDADRAVDPEHWLQLCGQFGITVWNSVPAIVGLLHEQAGPTGAARLAALRLVMMSGDRIPPGLPAALLALKPDLQVISLGGPTETTIWNILHPITPADDGRQNVPYGRPNSNNRAYVIDLAGRDTPDWVVGDICAGGVGLARGYWADPDRTDERFWPDERRGERLYRTGDLGRYRPDGEIEILGRSDFQIKVNGYRIEAGEVETRLVGLANIKRAVVVRQQAARGDRLVAHLVPAGADRPDLNTIREHLRVGLPDYMIPSAVVWHDTLPLTGNGKVDRARLSSSTVEIVSTVDTSEPVADAMPRPATAAPGADGLEIELAAVWANVLGRPEVAVGGDFYDLGGDSLAAARILTEVRRRYRVTLALDQMYEVRTVRAMAAHIAATAPAPSRGGTA